MRTLRLDESPISIKLGIATFALAAVVAVRPALADQQQYDVSGNDLYRVGSGTDSQRVTYDGTERLSIERNGRSTTYRATVTYARQSDDGTTSTTARFVQELTPDGVFEDRFDDDPDFLTILNQPFAVQLDPTTLRDVTGMRGKVPFDANSPLGGAQLHGYLRPGTPGPIDGRPAAAVRFEAVGPMTGTLPKGKASIAGTIRMDGIAYYARSNGLLLALDATLTITAQLQNVGSTLPVRIIYQRSIRAKSGAATPKPAAKSPMPPPPPSATPVPGKPGSI
jgi:hypothetical protein